MSGARAAHLTAAGAIVGTLAIAGCSSSPQLVQAPMLPAGYAMASADGGASPVAPAHALAGDYVGVGIQSNGPEWPMRVRFLRGEGPIVRAAVDYPSLGCKAEWKLEPAGDGEWTGEEHVVEGARCVPFGVIHLAWKDEGMLEWDWHDTTAKMSAHATLQKGPTVKNPFEARGDIDFQ